MVTKVLEMKTYRCKGKCGQWKPTTSYYVRKKGRKKGTGNNQLIVPELSRDPVCKDCRFEERQDIDNKIDAKVRKVIANEASKLGVQSSQLHEWGVTFKYVRYLLERELALFELGFHWCPNCKQDEDKHDKECFKGDSVDPDNFTFDVIDPERMYRTGKLTRSNIRWICDSANKAKGAKDPTDYDIEVIETYVEQDAFEKGYQVNFPSPNPQINKTIPMFN